MKWIKASERLPENRKAWYVFRQKNNTRSATTEWLEHAGNNIEGYFKLPLYNLEWLDESSSTVTEEEIKREAASRYPAYEDRGGYSEYFPCSGKEEKAFIAGAKFALSSGSGETEDKQEEGKYKHLERQVVELLGVCGQSTVLDCIEYIGQLQRIDGVIVVKSE